MNERIKQIAEESGLKVESWMTNPPTPFQILGSTEDFEKFAELIVKETMQVVANNVAWNSYLNAAEAVIEHFGVEGKGYPQPKCSVCGTTKNVKYFGGHQPYLCDSDNCIPF